MSKIGMIKEMDLLGRLVIPKELRERYGFLREVEIVGVEKGLLLQSPEYHLVKNEENNTVGNRNHKQRTICEKVEN